jgi:hypothetical protein
MVVQSYISWVGFHLAAYGTVVDIVSTMRNAAEVGSRLPHTYPYCPFHCPYTTLHGILRGVAQGYEQIRDRLIPLYGQVEEFGHLIVEAMSIFNNSAVWQTQFARAALLNGHIMSGMQSTIGELDPDISLTSGRTAWMFMLLNGALNSIEYYQTFDNASGLNPFAFSIFQDMSERIPKQGGAYGDVSSLDEPAQDAYRLMTELCHATRTPRFVSNRSESFATMALPAGPGMAILQGQKQGQTKFTEEDQMTGAEITSIGTEENYQIGQYLSSDDYATSGQGQGIAALMTAIVNVQYSADNNLGDAVAAYEQDGTHYRYTGPSSTSSAIISPAGGQDQVTVMPPFITPSGRQESYDEPENHAPWPGFAAYFKFKPDGDRTRDFNQPSTWIFLNKHHGDFQTEAGSHAPNTRAPWYSNFSWQNGTQVAELDTTIGGSDNSYLFEGLNVISRGMAYYHRPGHWQEQGQKLQAFWDRYVTQNITTESDSQVIQGMVALLRNAQMDLMTGLITSIITH